MSERRDEGDGDTVILLHGVNARPAMLWPVARALSKAGYRPLSLGYPSRSPSFERIVDTLATRMTAECRGGRYHIVAHSMGGLVAQAILTRHRPAGLGRVVMLAPPLAGSEWVPFLRRARLDRIVLSHAGDLLGPDRPASLTKLLGEIDYPLGIIAGDRQTDFIWPRLIFSHANDGKVAVAATHIRGETDHITLPVSHTLMLWNRRVHRQIIAFLQSGSFARL